MIVLVRIILSLAATLLWLPFFWFSWLGIMLSRLVTAFRKPAVAPCFPPLAARGQRRATIVILNWNGRHLLEENLPSVVSAAGHKGSGHDVLVVDNGSTDDSVEFVRRQFPGVELLVLPDNRGFGEGNNSGVAAARQDLVVLLNNDMRVEPDFLEPLLGGFDEQTFAVSAQIDFVDPAKAREETGKTAVCFSAGSFRYAHQAITEADERRGVVPVFWAGGGSSAFHRQKFQWLGGFDSLFSPCYVEDTDLSYRAWKMGWKIVIAPASKVHHQHRATSARRFTRTRLENIIQRNQLLFTWTNLGDWKCMLAHGLLFPWIHFRNLAFSDCPAWGALPQALGRWPAVMWRRLRRLPPTLSDTQILQAGEERFRFYRSSAGPVAHASSGGLRILMVTAYLPHLGYHAGAGRMFHLIRCLAERHEIGVVSFIESEEERERAAPLQHFCRSVKLLRRRPDYIRSLYIYEPFDAFYSSAMRRLILEALEERDYDLIHYEYAQMGRYYLRECPLPQLFTEHEVNYQACRLQSRLSGSLAQKTGWFYNYMQVMKREAAICQGMSRVICMTPEDARSLAGFVEPERLAVVRTGVDLAHFQPLDIPEKAHRLVFVGSFQHHPNCDAMLYFTRDIFPEVLKVFPEAQLSIVGSRPPAEIARLAHSGSVTVTGYVEDLRPYLAEASLYIVPLRLGVGIRGKILEAWAMQKPVIATGLACSGLPVRHRENAWVADSAVEFAAGIISLLQDAPMRRRLAEQGRRCALEQFSWEGAAQRLDSIYRQVLLEHSGCAAAPAATAGESGSGGAR